MKIGILNNRTPLAIINLAILATILAVGLWPFDFWPENQVRWLGDRNGVHFYGRGIAFSEAPIPIVPSIRSSNIPMNSMTIEIWVQPDRDNTPYLPYLLTLCDGEFINLILGQWQSTLALQGRILDPGRNLTPRNMGVENALPKNEKRFITITSDEKETSIYVGGKKEGVYPGYTFVPLINARPASYLVLGNSPNGRQPWTGNFLALAIYNRSLTGDEILRHFQEWMDKGGLSLLPEDGAVALYLFDERRGDRVRDHVGRHHLVIPKRFNPPMKNILIPPWRDFHLNRTYLMDIFTNVLGFIPFGFFFSACLWVKKPRPMWRLLLISMLLAGCTSLVIELLQVFLPTRNSQLLDLITNVLGTGIGATLLYLCKPRSSHRPGVQIFVESKAKAR